MYAILGHLSCRKVQNNPLVIAKIFIENAPAALDNFLRVQEAMGELKPYKMQARIVKLTLQIPSDTADMCPNNPSWIMYL